MGTPIASPAKVRFPPDARERFELLADAAEADTRYFAGEILRITI
jgi:hypothetical protein